MLDYTQLLDGLAYDLVTLIKMNMHIKDVDVSGHTSSTLRHETTPTKMTLYGSEVFVYDEKGRGPTKKSGPGVVRLKILEWIRQRGIKTDDPVGLSYAITHMIHNEGSAIHRRINGLTNPRFYTGDAPREIFSNVITQDRINEFTTLVTEKTKVQTLSDLIKSFK